MKELIISEIRERQLFLLDAVVEFCDANNLCYFLCGGTLIGAVRHKGYIPWDDDIDLMMPREDYERLIEEFECEGITLLSHSKFKDYYFPFVKISDDSTLCDEAKFVSNHKDMGANIDIFPIDNMPSSPKACDRFLFWAKFIRKCSRQKRYRFTRKKFAESLLRYSAKMMLVFFSTRTLCRRLSKFSQKYNHRDTANKGIVVWGYGKREKCRAEVFASSVKLEFEGKFYDAPVGYDEYLTNVYGDYMQLPPLRKQRSHHKFQVFLKEGDF